jgi:hypothetical protein
MGRDSLRVGALVLACALLSAGSALGQPDSVAPPFSQAGGSAGCQKGVGTVCTGSDTWWADKQTGAFDFDLKLTSPLWGAVPGTGSEVLDATLTAFPSVSATTGSYRITEIIAVADAAVQRSGLLYGSNKPLGPGDGAIYASLSVLPAACSACFASTSKPIVSEFLAGTPSALTDLVVTVSVDLLDCHAEGIPAGVVRVDSTVSAGISLDPISDVPDVGTARASAHLKVTGITIEQIPRIPCP